MMQSLVIFFYVVALWFLMELFNIWVDGKRVEAMKFKRDDGFPIAPDPPPPPPPPSRL